MADDPDALARLVHEQRLAHEADRAAAEGRQRFVLGTWEERTDAQRELDRRIAYAVAAQAVHDAGLRLEELTLIKTRLAVLVDLARRTRQAADAYDPPDVFLSVKADGLEKAVQVMKGELGGEGLMP